MSNDMCREVLGKESYTGKINSKSITWIHNNIDTYNKTVYTTGGYCMKKLNAQGITVKGVKSGYTKHSLNCLVTYVTKNGKPYIAVVAGVTGKGYSTINSTNIFLNYIN